MGRTLLFDDEQPFSERIKVLPREDLLDIWEETQQLYQVLRRELHVELDVVPEYERLILAELQRRDSGQGPSARADRADVGPGATAPAIGARHEA